MPEEVSTASEAAPSSSGQADIAAQIPLAWHYIESASGQSMGPVDLYQLAGEGCKLCLHHLLPV